jgi:hypothetical protein
MSYVVRHSFNDSPFSWSRDVGAISRRMVVSTQDDGQAAALPRDL